MAKFDTRRLSTPRLLRCFADILQELKQRGVTRTRNNPIADYAEWIISGKLGYSLQPNSNSGYDAKDARGNRYQIKSRRLDPLNHSRQLGVIRNLEDKHFDYLIGILFSRDFEVLEAYQIPHSIISKYAKPNKHQSGHILQLRGDLLRDPKVKEITQLLS